MAVLSINVRLVIEFRVRFQNNDFFFFIENLEKSKRVKGNHFVALTNHVNIQ